MWYILFNCSVTNNLSTHVLIQVTLKLCFIDTIFENCAHDSLCTVDIFGWKLDISVWCNLSISSVARVQYMPHARSQSVTRTHSTLRVTARRWHSAISRSSSWLRFSFSSSWLISLSSFWNSKSSKLFVLSSASCYYHRHTYCQCLMLINIHVKCSTKLEADELTKLIFFTHGTYLGPIQFVSLKDTRALTDDVNVRKGKSRKGTSRQRRKKFTRVSVLTAEISQLENTE